MVEAFRLVMSNEYNIQKPDLEEFDVESSQDGISHTFDHSKQKHLEGQVRSRSRAGIDLGDHTGPQSS